jgi:SAM-dependent methyltransferase
MDVVLHNQYAVIERDHWWFVARRAIIGATLRRFIPENRRRTILDVGCGTGGMLEFLSEYGETVVGLDMSPEAIAYCKERKLPANVSTHLGSLPNDMPPGTDRWDVVTAFDVIEHLDDDQKTLNDVYAALIPGGTFVATVPALQYLWGPHDDLNYHKRRYDAALLRDRLRAAGFVIEKLSYFNTILFPAVATVRVGRNLLSKGKKQEPKSDFSMPSPPVNRLLTGLFSIESGLVASGTLPIGVSLIAVGRKPSEEKSATKSL